MRQTFAKIDMGYARKAHDLANKFYFQYIKKHGMEYMNAHMEEYETEKAAYIKANI